MSLLEVSDLSIRFGATEVVSGLSFAIAPGERFGIIGESGSGKTLTSLAIAGLLPEGASLTGRIALDGAPMPASERDMARLRGRRIGMVFQEPMTALNPLMRVSEQIAESIRLNRDNAAVQLEVPALLGEVGLDPSHGSRFPHQLSGGQRQRVMIAMALASQPDLLIADEPTSALDLITQRKVLDLIAEICARRHMALLFISHDLKAVARLCTRVAVMHRGRLVERGEAAQVFASPQQDYTQKLVAASRFDPLRAERPPIGGTLLEVDGVTRDYRQNGFVFWAEKSLRAVNEVHFSVAQGECLALVGPSGCGKTTLAKIIVGLDRATSGAIRLDGTSYHGSDLPKPLRRDISLVFQDPFGSFNPRRSIGDSLSEPLRLEPGLDRPAIDARLVEAVTAVGLHADMLDRYPHEFSGGQRQRLAIARALVTRPKLLVLDEPVSALDVSVRGEVLALLARLQLEFGLTYLIISHDLDMVAAIADRVLVMEAGRIVEEGRPEQIFFAPQHRLTQELVGARLPDIGTPA
ncbi:peptide/nickel transport system ATP-binding protein [Devosia sp. YR412]|uniref:dipeptide ABC transporter ATP-binding protein n=1 Tax=Devosia sp. YR412 TaxID=1881030 RepID=UPI0008CEF6F3|nr:ABC transporter ATP-binding protein [Devosia sp. YR412]SEP86432.1 peptide/nickel transport system ATP-binding protein [Devosia sp. YR412]